jgi:CRP-like cAMP-binding protein
MDALISFFKKSKLFHDFTGEELQLLLPLAKRAVYDQGAYIVREEEKGDELFLIQSGSVEILKRDEEHQTEFHLGLLHENDSFGEMAVLGKQVRMASAKAVEKTEIVILHLKDLHLLANQSPVFSKLLINLAKKSVKHLERANQAVVKSLKEEMRLTRSHDQMAQFIIYLFIYLTAFVYALKFFEEYGSASTLSQVVISLFIISFGLTGVVTIKHGGYPPEFYGLTMKNWQRNALEAILLTIPILILMIGMKFMLIHTVPAFSKLKVLQFGTQPHSVMHNAFEHLFGKPERQIHFTLILVVYILLVPVQEFIARGCLQSSLRNFFSSSHRAFWSIFTSNLLFGLFHGLKSFTFALAAFILGLFWGWLYERQKTIIGPIVSHMLVGIWAFAFLNFQSILIY